MKKLFLIVLFVSSFFISSCYSCKTWQKLQSRVPADPNVKFMWEKGCRPAPMPLSESCPPNNYLPVLAVQTPAAVPQPQIQPQPVIQVSGGINTAERIYPCGGCGIVKLNKTMPASVQTGAEFEFRIKVTNLTKFTITDVIVTDILGENFQYKSSNPPATLRGNTLIWTFPSLQADQSVEIVGIGIASAGGIITECTNVSYTMPLCTQTVSMLPEIKITTSVPAEISLCDLINYTIKIENTGTGPASNVKVVDQLPSGLLTPDGSGKVEIPIGDVAAGSSKNVTISAKAYKTGSYTNSAAAVADGNINVSSAPVTTVVKQAVLNLVQRGPEAQYSDRELTYQIDLTNTGDMPALNTIIESRLPAGVTAIKVSRGGVVSGDKVIWKVSNLNPNAMAKMAISYMPNRFGIFTNTVKATASCADAAVSDFQTNVSGIGASLLEVSDLTDPVKIGSDTTYRILITNQGTAAATGINVEVTLEPEMQYVNSSGPTQGVPNNGVVTFAPLPSLASGAKATWDVTVKAIAEGDVRFKVKVTSDQLGREVMETESTHFYK